MKIKKISSWGRNKFINSNFFEPESKESLKSIIKKKKNFLAFGNGRSYGDVCLNSKNLISTRKLNKILNFDKKKGVIEVESGTLVSEILPIIIENNFFLPVTAGTKFISVGGMVANNIHGKNIKKNYFSDYILSLDLININGKSIVCSKKKNNKIFNTTIGGIGLTGIIYSIKFKLKKIYSLELKKKNIFFDKLNNLKSFKNFDKKYDYSVTWIDSFSSSENIKGIHFFTKHVLKKKDILKFRIKRKKINIFHKILFKIFNNYYSYRLVNIFFFLSHYLNLKKIVSIEDFFYIQDKYIDWNKIYGKNGFVEIHILVPKNNALKFLKKFFLFCKLNKVFSNLIVLKKLKQKKNNINFAGDGISISADFTNDKNFPLIKKFFLKNAGKYGYIFYFAKDSIVSKKNFVFDKEFYKFKKNIDIINKKNRITSLLSSRVGLTK